MKRILSLLMLLLAWGNASPLFAQESTEIEIELVRQLRLRGWHKLARDRIGELLDRKDPMLNAALPLELANLDIAEARQKNLDQRLALFTAAGAKLEDFKAKNQGKPQAALASALLARITSFQGQGLLSKAMREDDMPGRHAKARPAETMFIKAGTELDAAIKSLEAASAAPGNVNFKKALDQELRQARFDVAINYFDQARTYINRNKLEILEQRTGTIKKAQAAFIALRSDESSEIGWLASAWLMKCAMEMDNPDDVKLHYEFIMKRKELKTSQPSIQAAVRLVRFFAMQDLTPLRPNDPETIGTNAIKGAAKMSQVQRLHAVQTAAEAWIKEYSSYLQTYEGQGVLYELAIAYHSEALGEKSPKLAGPIMDKAVIAFDRLAKMDGEHSERARGISMSIKFSRLDSKAELRTFDDFMMKAEFERRAVIKTSAKLEDNAAKMAKAKGEKAVEALIAQKKEIDDDRMKHLKENIGALTRALAATEATPKMLDEALYFLSGAYLAAGDPYRAVIAAEALGRTRATSRSPEGAATAIATYAALQNRHPDDASIRKRLHAITEYVLAQKAWSGEPVTSVANYHMGLTYHKEGKVKEAIAHLEKIAPDFTDYTYVLGQTAFICIAAIEKTDNKKEQKELIDTAKRAVARMPKLDPKNDSPHVITMYFSAKVEMSNFIYKEAMEELKANEALKAVKKCNEMKDYVIGLQKEFEQMPGNAVSGKTRDQLDFTMRIMLKYGDLGIAETKFRGKAATRFDEVLAATKTVVDNVLEKAKAAPGQPIRLKDYRVTGDILGLALRANVQKGDVEKGKAILDVLQRLSGPNEGDKPGPVVAVLLNDIAGQIKSMVADNDKGLIQTRKHYTAFLDVIAKEYDAKGYDNHAAILLGRAYSSLDLPVKAAELFSKVKAPANIDAKIEKKENENAAQTKAREDWEAESNRHWGVQVEYIRALRSCKDKESLEKAEKLVNALIAHKSAGFKIQAMMEKNFILEDTQRYRNAYAEWGKFLKNPNLGGNLKDKTIRQIYFNGYFYQVRTLYKIGILDPKITDRQKYIDGAAKMIVNLEFTAGKEGWGVVQPLFEELLKEPESDKLKKAYDYLKAQKLKATSLSDPGREDRRTASVGWLLEPALIRDYEPEARARKDFILACAF